MKRLFALAAVALFVTSVAYAADAPPKMSPEQQAMMEKMAKAAAPGPQHEMLKKMAGEWNAKVTSQMDPSQPAEVEQSSSTLTMLMDGRYCQETTSGNMMGQPFSGMGVTGYDNVLGKFVSTWIDNMGTGIMTSQGTLDKSGKVITWVGSMSDPVTGKWSGDWGPNANDRNQITADFKFDGKALTGTITPAGGAAIPIQKGTFDAKTGAVHMEADVKPASGDSVHYVVDGKVDKGTMKGSWNHDKRKGDFSISKK